MVVKRAVGVGDVEPVVAGVPMGCAEEGGSAICLQRGTFGEKFRQSNLLYIHLLTCMARCQKYCHESKKATATHIWNAGTTPQ